MATGKDRITAHIRRLSQDSKQITTLVFTDKQLLELIGAATVALREGRSHRDGHHFAIWKREVKNCKATPPCEGGEAYVALVRKSGD